MPDAPIEQYWSVAKVSSTVFGIDRTLFGRSPTKFRSLIIATIAKSSNVAPAQVRFWQGVSVVRCEMRKLAMTESGHDPLNSFEDSTAESPSTADAMSSY